MNDKIRYVMATQDGRIVIDKTENTLKAFQGLVDGYIETVPAIEAYARNDGERLDVLAVINEEGRLRSDLHRNRLIPWLYGNVVFVDAKGDEFCGLSIQKVLAVIKALL